MLITYTSIIPLAGIEPSDALHQTLDAFQQSDTQVYSPTLWLAVFSMSLPDAIVEVAQALPPDTLGFSVGVQQERITAGEFLAAVQPQGRTPKPSRGGADGPREIISFAQATAARAYHFQGSLTDVLTLEESLNLLQRLYHGPPKMLRQTHFFILEFRNLHWNGAPPDAVGTLTLTDMKAFKKKPRFSLTATLVCRVEAETDERTRQIVHEVSDRTKIGFGKAQPFFSPDSTAPDAPSPEEQWIAEVCFQEALARTSLRLEERTVSLDGLPRLVPQRKVFFLRNQAITSGVIERIDLPAILKATLRREMPELKLISSDTEQVFFEMLLSKEMKLLVGFDRPHASGLGKTFSLLLGVRMIEGRFAGREWSESLLRLFGFHPSLGTQWTYNSRVELDAALVGVVALLRQVLPVFMNEVRSHLTPIPSSLPIDYVQRGAITARIGMQEAYRYAQGWAEDAVLYQVACSGPLRIRPPLEPCIDLDGRLRPHGTWHYGFYSSALLEVMSIGVPSVGSLQVVRFPVEHAPFPPLRQDWIDSDVACRTAAKKAQVTETELSSARFAGVLCELRAEKRFALSFDPSWKFAFTRADVRGNRRDTTVWLDAIGGSEFRLHKR